MSALPPYSERVLALFRDAPCSSRPDGDDWSVGEARDPLTGTWVRAHVRIRSGRIEAARYEVRGCPYTIAAAALIAQAWTGSVVEAAAVAPRELLAELGAPVTKLGRLLVVESAYRKALRSLPIPA
jgi:NifU-like protein involved in Fe-S cluster formation